MNFRVAGLRKCPNTSVMSALDIAWQRQAISERNDAGCARWDGTIMDEQVGTVYTLKGRWQERLYIGIPSYQINCLVPCKCSIYIYIAAVSRIPSASLEACKRVFASTGSANRTRELHVVVGGLNASCHSIVWLDIQVWYSMYIQYVYIQYGYIYIYSMYIYI